MRLFILIYSALVVAGLDTEEDFYDDYDILPDQITFSPMLFLFPSIKLSWNDASSVCTRSYQNQTLVTVVNDSEVSTLTLKRTGKFTSMWLGLVSSPADFSEGETTWVTCQPYNDNDYTQPFQNPNNTFNPTKRCALLTSDYMWEWRDCAEPHGFACNGKDFNGDANVPKHFFPTCGQNDVNSSPWSLPTSCFPDIDKPYFIRPDESSSHKPFFTYRNLKVTWNEAVQACRRNGMRLAVLDTKEKQERYLPEDDSDGLWIGLFREVRRNPIIPEALFIGDVAMWVNCKEHSLKSSANLFHTHLFPRSTHDLCTLMVGGRWSWRDCPEHHGFICEEQTDIYSEFRLTPVVGGLYWNQTKDLRTCPDPQANCSMSGCSEQAEEKSVTAFCVEEPLGTSTEETTVTPTMSSSTTINSQNTTATSASAATTTDEMSTPGSTVPETTSEDKDTTTTTELSPTPYLSSTTESTTESSTIITTTTAKPSQFACNTSCNCRCNCVKTVYVSQDEWLMAKESKSRWISSILEELTPNKTSLSSTRRRYKSAEDPRESVTTIGSLGVIFLVVVLIGILLLDMSALLADIKMLISNLRHVFYR